MRSLCWLCKEFKEAWILDGVVLCFDCAGDVRQEQRARAGKCSCHSHNGCALHPVASPFEPVRRVLPGQQIDLPLEN